MPHRRLAAALALVAVCAGIGAWGTLRLAGDRAGGYPAAAGDTASPSPAGHATPAAGAPAPAASTVEVEAVTTTPQPQRGPTDSGGGEGRSAGTAAQEPEPGATATPAGFLTLGFHLSRNAPISTILAIGYNVVFIGTVEASKSIRVPGYDEWDVPGDLRTFHTTRVVRWISAPPVGVTDTVVVGQLGGIEDGRDLSAPGDPVLAPGQTMLFLVRGPDVQDGIGRYFGSLPVTKFVLAGGRLAAVDPGWEWYSFVRELAGLSEEAAVNKILAAMSEAGVEAAPD